MLEVILKYHFLQNAIYASILSSIVCGIVGVIIVEKKLVMMSGGIAHTAYGGVGLGYLLGFEPIYGAMGFSVVAAIGVGVLRKRQSSNSDVIIAMFWSLGMAMGILFIGLMSGYPPSLNSYLFGNILTVTNFNIILTAIITVLVTTIIIIFFNDWKCYLFDKEFAQIIGLNTTFFEYLLLILVALTIVVLIRIVGIILVIALLSTPAAISRLLTNNFKNRMILSSVIGMISCFIGLYVSYIYNIPSGAVIIICLVFGYILFCAYRYFINKIKLNYYQKKIYNKNNNLNL